MRSDGSDDQALYLPAPVAIVSEHFSEISERYNKIRAEVDSQEALRRALWATLDRGEFAHVDGFIHGLDDEKHANTHGANIGAEFRADIIEKFDELYSLSDDVLDMTIGSDESDDQSPNRIDVELAMDAAANSYVIDTVSPRKARKVLSHRRTREHFVKSTFEVCMRLWQTEPAVREVFGETEEGMSDYMNAFNAGMTTALERHAGR